MAGRSARVVRTRRSQRLTEWLLGFVSTDTTTIPASSKVLLASIPGTALDAFSPATIIRTRGSVYVGSDQSAADEVQVGGLGLTFVSETAQAAGVASLPGPITQFGWEGWLWYQMFAQLGTRNTGGGTITRLSGGQVYEVDSKAMRKFTSDQSLVLVAENSHAAMGLVVMVQLRILVKAG